MSIIVVPADKGKWKVMVDYIQHGIEYSNQALANKEAQTVREEIFGKTKN